MDSSYERFVKEREKSKDSIYDELLDFQRLRISALTKAAEISPLVKESTIGPRSPVKNEITTETIKDTSDQYQENLIHDTVREDLRHTLNMKRFDRELKKNSGELFNEIIEKMIVNRAEVMSKFWKKKTEECERRSYEQRRRKLQLLQSLHDNDNLTVLQKAKFDEEQCQKINQQSIESVNQILEEQNKAAAQLAAITDSHTQICICYNELTHILQTEPLAKTIFSEYLPSIDSVVKNINNIMDACKTGVVTEKQCKQAEILAINIDSIKKKIKSALQVLKQNEIINKQKELDEAKERELKKKQEAADLKKEQDAKEAELARQKCLESVERKKPLFYSPKNYNYYLELKEFLDSYENKFKALLDNKDLKKFRFDCQKAVNTPVNAISSVSRQHIQDKYHKLSQLLQGNRVGVLDFYITATEHKDGMQYCTALLAKKIVRQGDLLVSSNLEAAFPLASVTVALWSQLPTLGKLLEANFVKFCPYLVPMFLPQKEGQTDKEFYLSRGYTYNDEGVVEKQDKFLKRMSGIFRLQCAIWIAKVPSHLNAQHPHGLRYGWQWLASFINLKPEPDICATLLYEFFTICGSEFFKHYGKQFIKIIKLISTEYMDILQKIDEGGPKTRLEVLLQNVLKSGHIPPPTGLLPANFW